MRLYLAQHGEAVDKSVDPDRPLSRRGEQDVRGAASVLARAETAPKQIMHSGKIRAKRTAEIFAETLTASADVGEISGIAPLDSVVEFAKRLPELGDVVMLCGHQPFMGRLVSYLLAGNEKTPLVEYVPGSVACLESTPDNGWVLCWFLRPELCQVNQ